MVNFRLLYKISGGGKARPLQRTTMPELFVLHSCCNLGLPVAKTTQDWPGMGSRLVTISEHERGRHRPHPIHPGTRDGTGLVMVGFYCVVVACSLKFPRNPENA